MRSIQVNMEQGRPVMGRTRVSWESHMWQENETSVGSGVVRPQTCPSNARHLMPHHSDLGREWPLLERSSDH